AELRKLFLDLDALPAEVPPLELRDNFLAMLNEEKAKLAAASPSGLGGLRAERGGQPLPPSQDHQALASKAQAPSTNHWPRIAASVALVAIGAVLGLLLRGGQPAATLAVTPEAQQPAVTLSTRLAAARQEPAT